MAAQRRARAHDDLREAGRSRSQRRALGGFGPRFSQPREARTIATLGPSTVGREVLVYLLGDDSAPVVVGFIRAPGDEPTPPASLDLAIDRRRLILSAQEEVVVRCGKASIRLTADGKVVLEGADLVSSAKRVNRIRGGVVRIN